MDVLNALSTLGPVAGTVIVVIIFVRFAGTYMKNERCHREKIATECHAAQKQSTEATFKAGQAIEKNSKVLEQVNVTLIQMNGHHRKGD